MLLKLVACMVWIVKLMLWCCGIEPRKEDKDCMQTFSGKPVIRCLNGNLRQRWEDNIKIDHRS
jgi:hypothetical protein